jgi:transmembrane 9 superfamily protein 3
MKNGVMRVSLLFTFFVLFVATLKGVTGDEYDHKYASGDPIKLWVNKVGPYNNPQETYNYYELPFCKVEPKDGASKKPVHKWGGLGEILEGNELILSNVEFKFRQDLPKRGCARPGS